MYSALRLLCLCCLLCSMAYTLAPQAQAAPLLQEGKKSLYQRVVSHPGAQLRTAPDSKAPLVKSNLVPFSALYVHARQEGWLQVGRSIGAAEGWLEADVTTPWNQSLTLLFSPPSGRDPVLFFKTETDLHQLCAAPDMETRLDGLLAAVRKDKAAQTAASFPVLASEPLDEGAVSEKRFYLMPILDMKDPFEGVKFLQVASIDPGTGGSTASVSAQAGPPRTGIALVIDTTISMKPYIEQSLNVVRAIYDSIEKDKMADNVGFAVVAYRSSTAAVPGLEYVSTVVSDFATAKDRQSLESRLAQVREATVSSHDFNEDSLAAVQQAVQDLSWEGYSSRLILLITDAGPLKSGDKYASTPMGVNELNDLARQKGIWITTLHIKSPGGAKNHNYAEQSYRALSRLSGQRANYQAVAAPTPAEGARQFATVAKTQAQGMVDMVRGTAEGRIMTRPKDSPTDKAASPEEEARRLAATLGYAMQLEYLGRTRASQAPTVVNSWIADMDLKRLARQEQSPSVEVAVLLTKNQLNDLGSQLRAIIDSAERTKKTDSRDFFRGILSASARMARDPNLPTAGKSLAELGLLAEFLDGLPYKSDIMLLREEDWYRMSVGEQTAFINRLKSRLARYEEYDKDQANWESFGQANAGDWVYRVPLSMLP